MIGIHRWATVTQLREDLAEVIDYVSHHQGRVAVSRHLQMVAVLVNPSDFDQLVRAAGRRWELERRLDRCRCEHPGFGEKEPLP